MDKQKEILIIDKQIQEEIEKYKLAMHEVLPKAPQIIVDINPKKKFEVLEKILLNSKEGYIHGEPRNEKCEELCKNISSQADRYKRRKLFVDKKSIWSTQEFWTKCLSHGQQVFFYLEYDQEIFKSIFLDCSSPSLLGNARSLFGSRLQSIRKNVEKQSNLIIITLVPESEGMLLFSSIELLHKVFDISLENGNISQGVEQPWGDLLWQKAHLEEPNGIEIDKFRW